MHGDLKNAFESYLNDAKKQINAGSIEAAVENLERAHVLGQRFVLPHLRCHLLFLRIGWIKRSLREMSGQSIRLVLGIIGSTVGVVPTGNTGGTNVGMFRTMPIDPHLSRLLSR